MYTQELAWVKVYRGGASIYFEMNRHTSKKKVTPYASGGFIEDGIFTMNKGELAGNFFDGTPVVA